MNIISAIIPCIWIGWPATIELGTNYNRYETYMSAELESTSTTPASVICFDDNEVHAVVIYARDADGNYSDPSEAQDFQYQFNCDADGNGEVAVPDLFKLIPLLGLDFSVFDLLACIDRLGECNNGVVLEECV